MKPYYQTLEVEENATQEEIKSSWKRLAKIYHPDKQGGSEEKQKEINEAYSILGDPEKRSQYDNVGIIENGSIEDQAKKNLTELFEFAISEWLKGGKPLERMFIVMHRTVNEIIKNAKYKISEKEYEIESLESTIGLIEDDLKEKSNGESYCLAIENTMHLVEKDIIAIKLEILQLEADIRLREKMLEILESDYPEEPELEPEYKIHSSGIFIGRNIT